MTTTRFARSARGWLLWTAISAAFVVPGTAAAVEPAASSGPGVSAQPSASSGPGGSAGPAASLVPVTWGVAPSSEDGPDGRATFEYLVERGTVTEDYVGVSNFSNAPLELAVYASDAFTTAEGGFDLLPAAEEPVDVGAWVSFSAETVTVPARSRMDIPFRITVPDTARPGDHPGGIVASVRTVAQGSDGGQVVVDRRVGARIYLRVEGELHAALAIEDLTADYLPTLDPFAGGGVTLHYTVRNVGNVRASGSQAMTVAGPFGIGLLTVDGRDLPEILPGQSFATSSTVSGVAPLVHLDVALEITPSVPGPGAPPPGTQPAQALTTTWAIPWVHLALVMLALYAFIRRRRLRREDRAGGLEQPTAAFDQPGAVIERPAPDPAIESKIGRAEGGRSPDDRDS